MSADHISSKLENIISGHGINQDDADWLRAIACRQADRVPLPDWSIPQEITDQQIEFIFCEMTGIHYEELIDSLTDTFKSCQWFRRGYRRALATQQSELSRQDQSQGDSIGHSVSGIDVKPFASDNLPTLTSDNIDGPLPEHSSASVSTLAGVGVVGGIAASDDLNHLAMLSELECPPDPETVDRAITPSSQELHRHAAKGQAIIKRLYNDPADTISMVSVGEWIEYADQLLRLMAISVPVTAYDRLHALNEQNAGRLLELEEAMATHEAAPQQAERVPLSDEQLWGIWNDQGQDEMDQDAAMKFARSIERAQGIGVNGGEA